MAEFIIDLAGVEVRTAETASDRIAALWGFPLRGKLVRCKDCKHYTPESMTREERGFGIYEDMWEPGGCFNPERCSTTWDSLKGEMVPVGIVTEPDGFCKWGVRRTDQ